MTTSGSTNYSETRAEIITDALYKINAVASEESVSVDDMALGSRQLNRMIKAWEGHGIHLWTKGTAVLFPQYNQATYQIYSSGAHATETYHQTTLSAAAVIGATTLTVTSSSGFSINDYIGIVQDDNTLHWTTITGVPTSTSITISVGLTAACAVGNYVFAYTTRLDQPYKIYSMNRIIISSTETNNIDISLKYKSYEDFFALTNKSQRGIPTIYNYVKGRDYGLIQLWLVPENINNLYRFTFERRIQDFDTASDTSDFPQEWLECLTINLAYKLCPFFGKSQGELYQNLKLEAETELQLMLQSDNEMGSLFIEPDYEGGYR